MIRPSRLLLTVLAFAAFQASCGSSGAKKGAPLDGGAATAVDGSTGAPAADGSVVIHPGDGGTIDSGASCPPYEQLCGGSCIPTVIDPKNCGGCGVTCPASQVCSGGACSALCLPGLTPCNQACVDTTTDNGNCGICGTVCPPGHGCGNGTCVPAAALGDAGGACVGGGPPVSVVVDGGGACVGAIAQTSFTWALCSCGDITFSASVLTDAWSSSKGPYTPGGVGGGVGLDGKFSASVPTVDIGGTLWEASDGGMSQEAETIVREELHVGGPLYGAALTVRGDVHVTGDVSGAPGDASAPGLSYFSIDGGLFVSPGDTVTGRVTYSGAVQPQLVPVGPPCDCTHPVPVAAIATAGATTNDNALIGLDPKLLSSLDTPARIDLPCGVFYFDAMKPTGPLTIVAHGHTVILVGGDLFTTSPLEMTVDPTGSLDIFIGGTISDSAHLAFGNPNYPALERVYVGTPLGIPFTGDVELAANLYAAASSLVSWSSTNVIYGGVVAGNFISSQPTVIHYDLGVLESGASCVDAGIPECGSCSDCGNQACVGGKCGACTSNNDCCAPLLCSNGVCGMNPP